MSERGNSSGIAKIYKYLCRIKTRAHYEYKIYIPAKSIILLHQGCFEFAIN
jgi:hypothetical protein